MDKKYQNIFYSLIAGFISLVIPYIAIFLGAAQGYYSKRNDLPLNILVCAAFYSVPAFISSLVFSFSRDVSPFSDKPTFIIVYVFAALIFYLPTLVIFSRPNKKSN